MKETIEQRVMRRLRQHPMMEQAAVRLMKLIRVKAPVPPYRSAGDWGAQRPLGAAGPIFVTARFRSGSTLLWQAFDRLKGFRAYYEPLNERQWFDPDVRGEGTDATHRGATNYAANYDGLSVLGQWFTEDWTYRKLVMSASDSDAGLVSYIPALLAASTPERAVLQFNRVDFRLPFLRHHFPEVSVLHLRRNVRDSWRSTLKGERNDPAWNLLSFEEHNHFYLLPWYRDLAISYPWLLRDGMKTHPYLVHYLVARLSDLFAAEWADISISYEELCADIKGTFGRIFGHTHSALMAQKGTPIVPKVCPFDLDVLDGLMAPRTEPYDHTHDEAFYDEQEAAAEALLQKYLPIIRD